MIRSKYIKSLFSVVICSLILTIGGICSNKASAVAPTTQVVNTAAISAEVKPLQIVNSPSRYLNQKIVMRAKFDKFSTLGLDYKPAMRSSENYISFLIMREDTAYEIPLSEMKLFLKRETAEKFIDLKTGDEVKIVGTVFSDALGDSWIDVDSLTVLNKAPEQNGVK